MNNISTDEITPGWVCFYYDETLGQYVYVGMREAAVQKDEVKKAISEWSSPASRRAAARRAKPRLTRARRRSGTRHRTHH
jgi:hypothetical protein